MELLEFIYLLLDGLEPSLNPLPNPVTQLNHWPSIIMNCSEMTSRPLCERISNLQISLLILPTLRDDAVRLTIPVQFNAAVVKIVNSLIKLARSVLAACSCA